MKRTDRIWLSILLACVAGCAGPAVTKQGKKPKPPAENVPVEPAPPANAAVAALKTDTSTPPAVKVAPSTKPGGEPAEKTVGTEFADEPLGGKTIRAWVVCLRSGDRDAVLEACEILRNAPEKAGMALPALTALTKSKDRPVIEEATYTLNAIKAALAGQPPPTPPAKTPDAKPVEKPDAKPAETVVEKTVVVEPKKDTPAAPELGDDPNLDFPLGGKTVRAWIQILHGSNEVDIKEALEQLQVAPERAKAAIPVLKRLRDAKKGELSSSAGQTLERIEAAGNK